MKVSGTVTQSGVPADFSTSIPIEVNWQSLAAAGIDIDDVEQTLEDARSFLRSAVKSRWDSSS